MTEKTSKQERRQALPEWQIIVSPDSKKSEDGMDVWLRGSNKEFALLQYIRLCHELPRQLKGWSILGLTIDGKLVQAQMSLDRLMDFCEDEAMGRLFKRINAAAHNADAEAAFPIADRKELMSKPEDANPSK